MRARIALNALALRPGGSGVQTYIRELLRELVPRLDAELVAAVQADAAGELPPGVEALVRRPCAGVGRTLTGLRSLGPSDLVHGLDVDLPLRNHAPTVATVHDLAVFDVPWAFPWWRARGEQATIAQALRRADRIIAVSGFTAERVKARFGREAVVVPLAAGPDMRPPSAAEVERVRSAYGLDRSFVLHVGTVEPRKDVATLAASCRLAGVPLVLAGATPDPALVPAGTRALGYVPRGDLGALYGAATVVAYPSRYEGFGLPPLEAMACGAPVVASRVASLPEVLGGGAELFRPGAVEELASVLHELLSDEARRAALSGAGQRVAGRLTWRATAAATAGVYRSLGVDTGDRLCPEIPAGT
ncbi:MAG: glycosyltransferase family 4 protein [Actinomycetota bacterium]|nr:glycosyltransferase family 4 protein [Actinomycetota bacterium]